MSQEQIALLEKLNELVKEQLFLLSLNDRDFSMPRFGLLCLVAWPIKAQFEQWELRLVFNAITAKYAVVTHEDVDLLVELNQNIKSMLFAETMADFERFDENIVTLTNELKSRGFMLSFKNGKYSIGE